MVINKNLMSRNHTALKRTKNDIKWIVVHYVGALGDAKANTDYYKSTDVGASADFWVGHTGDIWQGNDFYNYYSWHCGGGNSGKYFGQCTNRNSIGIEMCVHKRSTKTMNAEDKDWYFETATINSAAQLIRDLMEDLDIDIGHVIRHYDVNYKTCPNPFVYDTGSVTWKDFKDMILSGKKETVFTEWYRVGTGWSDGKCIGQIGAYQSKENAVKSCPYGYKVYDADGNVYYEPHGVKGTLTYATLKALSTDAQRADAILTTVRPIALRYGLFPSVIAAQCCLESGYGCGTELSKSNNVLGMKANLVNSEWYGSTWDGQSVVTIHTPEYYNGKLTYIDDQFRVYKSIDECVEDICAFFTTMKKYVNAGIKEAKTYTEQISIESRCGYATDPNYISKVCKLIEQYSLDKYDAEKTGKTVAEPAKKDEDKSMDILTVCTDMDKAVREDNAAGKQWYYYNSKPYCNTFANARATGQRWVSCANGVCWALKAAGLMTKSMTNFYGQNGKIVWPAATKKDLKKNFKIVNAYGKTVQQCLKKGLIPENGVAVVMFKNITHTMMYVRGKWFDTGHANCSGSGEGAKFNRWVTGTTPYSAYMVSYLLVLKEETKKYYRVQTGAYITKKNADKQARLVKAQTGFDSFVERGTDLLYHVYTGSFEQKSKADERVSLIQAKNIKCTIK